MDRVQPKPSLVTSLTDVAFPSVLASCICSIPKSSQWSTLRDALSLPVYTQSPQPLPDSSSDSDHDSFPSLGSDGLNSHCLFVSELVYWRVLTPPEDWGALGRQGGGTVSLLRNCAAFLFVVPSPSAWAASAHRGRPNSVVAFRHPRCCWDWEVCNFLQRHGSGRAVKVPSKAPAYFSIELVTKAFR